MNDNRPYIVTFTDLVYAALLSYGLDKLDQALSGNMPGSILVGYIILLMFYDWYGEHWLAVQRRVGTLSITLDIIALIIYFFLVYAGFASSIYYILLLAFRAFRGIVYNYILLKFEGNGEYKERLMSFNLSSSFMLIGYLVMFSLGITLLTFSSRGIFIIALVFWLTAYLVSYTIGSIYSSSSWWVKLNGIVKPLIQLFITSLIKLKFSLINKLAKLRKLMKIVGNLVINKFKVVKKTIKKISLVTSKLLFLCKPKENKDEK